LDRETTARHRANAAWPDIAIRSLNMSLVSAGCGRATVSMDITADMVNGYQICHGGFLFSLAEAAFAVARCTINLKTIVIQSDIAFIVPARIGDHLLARAHEQSNNEALSIYDVSIVCGETPIAQFRGLSTVLDDSACD
jgi:acyl-CoA thioesterase